MEQREVRKHESNRRIEANVSAHTISWSQSDVPRRCDWGCRVRAFPPKGVSEAVFQVKQSSSFCHPLEGREKKYIEIRGSILFSPRHFWVLGATPADWLAGQVREKRRRSGADLNKRLLKVGMRVSRVRPHMTEIIGTAAATISISSISGGERADVIRRPRPFSSFHVRPVKHQP